MKSTPANPLWQLAGSATEIGLQATDAGLRAMHQALGGLGGGGADRPADAAPLDGPGSVDAATADFANRLLRAVRRRGWFSAELTGELLEAATKSFSPLWARSGVECLTLPWQMPLSLGTLATQEGLRGLMAVQSVPPQRIVDFLLFVIEIFSDLEIYFTLSYRDELARLEQAVARAPGDAPARLEYGRTLMKCGLFAEAVQQFEHLSGPGEVSRRAAYESIVCHYRLGDYAAAVDAGLACLAGEPGDPRALHWLFLAADAGGGYPQQVPDQLRIEVKDGWHPAPLVLEEVADEIGLAKVSGGRGTAVFDFDGDGHLDVAIAGAHSGICLYHNNGDGTFRDVSTGSGLDQCVYAFALAAGDYDNDGLPDLYVSSLGFFNGEGKLMHNNGDGTFRDVTREAGLSSWGPGFTATWVDYDGDGRLDLFLANNLGGLFDRKTPNRLFHNNGDGTFRDVTREAGLHTPWPTIGAAWGDINNDGRPDLFVSSIGRAQLFRNNGDGTFRDVSRAAGIDRPATGSVAMWCDFDDDGWLDIIQATYARPLDAIHTLRHGQGPPGGSPLRVFRNNRDGTFSLVSPQLGISGCWGTMSLAAGDYDNDGFQDLLLGNGDPSMDRSEPAVLLASEQARRYHNVTFSSGLPLTGKGHGVVMADLAGDGRLHLVVANGGLYPGDLQTTAVYRPPQRPGNYLGVQLLGRESNRDAVGARLALLAGERWQHRLVSGGSNFGCSPYRQHFGLHDATAVQALEIRWPSGRQQRIEQLPVNTTILIDEAHSGWRTLPRRGRDGDE